jgi:hypothetical protein
MCDAIGWRNMEIPMRVVGAFGVVAGWCTWGGATLFARSGGALAAGRRDTALVVCRVHSPLIHKRREQASKGTKHFD